MDRLQVGDLVRTDTGIIGQIVTISQDGRFSYVRVAAEVGARLIRFDVAALERIEPTPTDSATPPIP